MFIKDVQNPPWLPPRGSFDRLRSGRADEKFLVMCRSCIIIQSSDLCSQSGNKKTAGIRRWITIMRQSAALIGGMKPTVEYAQRNGCRQVIQ